MSISTPQQTLTLPVIQPKPITNENFERWGQVVRLPDADPNAVQVNQGTAQKFSHLAKFTNLRPAATDSANPNPTLATAEANIAIFKCYKPVQDPQFQIKLLERHSYSSQMFMPMGGDGNGSYVVVTAENGPDDKPVLETLQAFRCNNTLGINYKPNVWHHPMIVVEKPVQFMTITYESGVGLEDCEEYWFTKEAGGVQGGAAALINLV
ncbi:Allantoicase [Podila epicladia]|nr:Allantoicase [Podila epicladia]KAG0096836.1 Allantoicase [Podila epicladia]